MIKRSPTTKDVALLWQLQNQGQLNLSPEFQRNSVWPPAAKAYLIDTILNDKPIPLFFLQRSRSAQTGQTSYSVIDGQQRLRAIFDFIDDRFRLTQSDKKQPYYRKLYSQLPAQFKDRLLNYDLVVDELSGYTDADIRDMFIRMNRYVVKLSPQELRHAKHKGAFFAFAERLGRIDFWSKYAIFSKAQIQRMRHIEFAAELAILVLEGPQDKKKSLELYYVNYRERFDHAKWTQTTLTQYLAWIAKAVPDLSRRFLRKPTDLYGLIGALRMVTTEARPLSKLGPARFRKSLEGFEAALRERTPKGDAARYVIAASRQTDNIGPRSTRIEIMAKLLLGEF